MQSDADVIAGLLKDIEDAPDSDALFKIGTQMAADGITDEGLRDAYRKSKKAFQSTS